MQWPPFGNLPVFEWRRRSTPSNGGRRLWITSLDRMNVFPWRTPIPAATLTGSASVVGSIGATFTPTPARSATVIGEISARFGHLGGAVDLTGSATCQGVITATFGVVIPASATVKGEIRATFYRRAGQQADCIAGPGTPAAGAPPNVVY